MFAWVKAKNPDRFGALLKSASIKVVAGQHCGADPEEGWFRISLGLDAARMDEAMEAFALKEQ
jgi:aspartate/methionine/tyrosine aminotransferase